MRISRFFQPQTYTLNGVFQLSDEVAHHASRVLRLPVGAIIELFNGDNHSYTAEITAVSKKSVEVKITAIREASVESDLKIHLAQGISKGDRMDFVLQKSVELGVHAITPLFTERCNVKLSGDRLEKKQEQWQKIVIAACEQSGRNFVPKVLPAIKLSDWLAAERSGITVTLDPHVATPFAGLAEANEYHLLIGPEGGFSEHEVLATAAAGCHPVQLGPRILRTETAALAAITALQCHFGDLG